MQNGFFLTLLLVGVHSETQTSHKFGRSKKPEFEEFLLSAWSGEACILEDNELPNLQVVFMVDASLPGNSKWHLIQAELTKHIMELVKRKYTAEFALTSYNAGIGTNCFNVLQSFTSNSQDILQKIEELSDSSSQVDILSDCSFTLALLLTVTDGSLDWDDSLFTLSHTAARKIVVTYPLRTSKLTMDGIGGRHEPTGDGSDTCSNSLPPSPDTIYHVLEENNIFLVIGGYEVFGLSESADGLLEFYQHILPAEISCGAFYNYGNSRTGFKGYKSEDVGKIDFRENALELFECIVDEVKTCVWEDPPAYNTLGK